MGGGLRGWSRGGWHTQNSNLYNLHRIVRTVIAFVARTPGDVFYQSYGCFIACAEDSVVASIEPGCGRFRNKKLGAIGVRARVGVSEAAGSVELHIGKFVGNLVAGTAGAVSERITALDHEVGNYAMKDGPVIERNVVHLLFRLGIFPVFRARGQ